MKKLLSILILALAVFGLAVQPATAVYCTSPVIVDPDGSDPYLTNLQSALNRCTSSTTYSDNLEFRMTAYTENVSVMVPSGYTFSSGKQIIIDGRYDSNGNYLGSSSVWETSGRFVWAPTPDPDTSYAIFTNGANIALRGIQFKALISDYWWGGNGVLLLAGNTTLEDCFIWLYTPTSVNWSQNGNAIKIIGDGNYVVRNTIIYGDNRAGTYFNAALWAGSYVGTINVYNTTINGRGASHSFAQGIYRQAVFTGDVSNSYIRVHGVCVSAGFGGDYNGCHDYWYPAKNGIPGTNSFTFNQQEEYSFEDYPNSVTAPNYSVRDTSSVLYNTGSTTRNHADLDINGDTRSTSGSISIGADEY